VGTGFGIKGTLQEKEHFALSPSLLSTDFIRSEIGKNPKVKEQADKN
jgi:hypothetical protein